MSKINYIHYVGITVPHCALTYGELPCHAQLSYADGDDPELVGLNEEYGTRGAGLSGAADSNKGTGSFWFYSGDLSGNKTIFAGATTVGGTTTRFRIRLVGNELRITAANTSGTTILDIRTSADFDEDNLYHVMFSFDLSNTGRRHLYVDGADDLAVTTFTNSTIDYTLADWSIGALPNGTELSDGDALLLAQFWFEDGVYIDLSDSANREKFRSNDGRPVDLGSNGENPTGSAPIVYFPRGSGDWESNDGTGGGFTIHNDGGAFDNDFSTGGSKCFNSLGTCQDIANFDNDPAFLIFGEDVANVFGQFSEPILPFIKDIDFQSAIVSLGDNMGQRGSITVKLRDGPHNDTPASQFDKYRGERGYDPLDFGTFWGRFKARNPYMRFQSLVLFTMTKTDDSFDDESQLTARTYLIESISGPSGKDFEVTITAKDLLKVADGDFAQAPVQSPGFLASDIDDNDTTATMSPSGAIDEYPDDGYICIGGNEIVGFSKAGGDVINISRGELGTPASDHSAQDRLQLVLYFDSVSPDIILDVLLEEFADVDGDFIDTDAWAAEVLANLGTVLTLVITEPTSVKDLVSEVILQIGGAIWWDDANSQIRLQILKNIATDAERWNEDSIISQTLEVQEQESKRITEVSVYFAQINPTLKVDETRNYASVATVTDETMEGLVGSKSIKTIFARGIASGGRSVAERLAQKYLSRYVVPPRRFNFELMKYTTGQNPQLGGGYLLGGGDLQYGLHYQNSVFQQQDGARVEVPIQVTRVDPVGPTYKVEAEEMLFTAFGGDIDPTNHTIIFDVSRNNVNLQETHDDIYAEAQSGDTVNCYINGGVIIGSNSTSDPAFVVGSFAGGVTVNLFINGRIQGAGGNGDGFPTTGGKPGGTALYTRQNINLENNSQIWGGGGGGGMSNGPVGSANFSNSGGGGAGSIPGIAGNPYNTTFQNKAANGTTEAGGAAPFSSVGGNGGGPGLAGQNSTGGAFLQTNGGAAGAAVDGNSFISYSATGDRRGGIIN